MHSTLFDCIKEANRTMESAAHLSPVTSRRVCKVVTGVWGVFHITCSLLNIWCFECAVTHQHWEVCEKAASTDQKLSAQRHFTASSSLKEVAWLMLADVRILLRATAAQFNQALTLRHTFGLCAMKCRLCSLRCWNSSRRWRSSGS